MRQRYDAMFEHCPILKLWGLSVLGTSGRMYLGDTLFGDLSPPLKDRPSIHHVLPSTLLENCWPVDQGIRLDAMCC